MDNVQDFVLKKQDYLHAQVGNPEGADKPNKKVSLFKAGKRVLLMVISSTTILESGSVRAKRRSRSVSRSHARTSATSVSRFIGDFS